MRPLTATELIDHWESGLQQSLLDRMLRLLSTACGVDPEQIASLSIGERDARLLQLREWIFGSRLLNIAYCPHCAEKVEWESAVQQLRLQSCLQADVPAARSLETAGYTIRYRLPNTLDICAAYTNAEALLQRCILEVQPAAEPALPEQVAAALMQRMSEEDPQADIRMLLNCPACGHQWEALFDIASYLWAEVHQWALRLLQEVGLLASAFGWSEKEILNMSAQRRQLYLEMI
ncbi:hypothetical protein [uncultured Chitinophaga sp.]|jgi:hypothetical protein|uniref:T4 family baseplate hub assembly chaperone n=1 Tax=uncultured Chitinophaga sp. TaxID=339340 RepID=UPI0026283F3A|nr:hypothetical protein [uncultured Chitinophaga sp.]